MDIMDFEEQLQEKLTPSPAPSTPIPAPEPKKRGRPPKEKDTPKQEKKIKVEAPKVEPPKEPVVDKTQYGERHWTKTWCVCLEDDKFVMYADGKNVGYMPRRSNGKINKEST